MKTTRLITTLALAAGIAALASCQKSEPQTEAAKTSGPVLLTLRVGTATPDAPDTKVSYTDNVTTISASWEAGDEISLVQLNKDGKAIKAETFKAKTAGTTVDFEGTFTRDANATSVTVVYPAVDPTTWKSIQRHGVCLLENYFGYRYVKVCSARVLTLQPSDNALPYLNNVALMFCNTADLAALESGSASVSLKCLNYIVKMKVKVASLATVKSVSLSFPYTRSSGAATHQTLGPFGRVVWKDFSSYDETSDESVTYLGTDTNPSGYLGNVTGIAPDSDGCITVYMVNYNSDSIKIDHTRTDAKVLITASGLDASSAIKTLSYSATLTSDIIFSPGYLYTLEGVKELTE